MKRILSIALALFIAATTTVISQSQIDKAKDLIKQKKYDEAIAVSQSYLQSNARDENGWLILAKAYQQSGSLDSAEMTVKKAIQLDDELMEGYTVLGQVQLAKKNALESYTTAKAGLKMTKRKQPKYPPLLVVLGQSLIVLDSADAALVSAAEAKELDPQQAAAYEVIGDAYLRQKVAPMAISSYEKSLEIDSLQQGVLYKIANTYKNERQYTEAARIYYRILALDPTNDAARLELAGLLYRAKQWAKCAAVLKDYFVNHKNPPKDLYSIYLEALYKSKQYKESFEVAKAYLKLEPNSVLAYRSIAYGNLIDKQFAQSVEAYKKIASLDTMEFDDYRWLGTAYKQLKKDSLAAATWKEALKDTAQSVALRSYLYGEVGSYYMSSRQYEQASEYFLKRYHVDTTAVASMINYAKCIMEMKEFDKAVSALQEAITRYPKYPGAHISLGFCYAQMKDYDLSRKEFETAVKLIDTTDSKYSKYDLADSYRMIALSIMVEKKSTSEESKKKWEDAIIYLKKSLKYNEGVGQTHLWLGQCFQNLNKLDDAIKEYKRTIQLDPKNDEAKKYLADLLKLKGD
jgi:tetratricopeptide (TPR) repeat protein